MSDNKRRPRLHRMIAGATISAALLTGGMVTAGEASAEPNCVQQMWWRGEAFRFVTRTLCDGPIFPDGSWMRARNFYGAAYYVPVSCSYYSCTGGYWRPVYDSGVETYPVTAATVLADEPGHIA